MARQLRIELAGGLYHVLSRGNEKKRIFKSLGDRGRFLSLLEKAHQKHSCTFYAYAILPNHFHLLLETKKQNLSRAMHFINSSYSIYFNKKHKRVGHLLQGRYKAILVQKEPYLLELSRYIHTNADRAGFRGKMGDRGWTSYCFYTGSCKKTSWLRTEWIIDRFGKDWSTAKKEYDSFTKEGLKEKIRDPFENTYRGTMLGSESFIKSTKRSLKEGLGRDIASHKSFSTVHTFDSIIEFVAAHFEIPPHELFGRRRLFFPRQIAMYLLKEYTDLTLKDIGQHFNVSGFAVSMNAKSIKKNKSALQISEKISELLKKP